MGGFAPYVATRAATISNIMRAGEFIEGAVVPGPQLHPTYGSVLGAGAKAVWDWFD